MKVFGGLKITYQKHANSPWLWIIVCFLFWPPFSPKLSPQLSDNRKNVHGFNIVTENFIRNSDTTLTTVPSWLVYLDCFPTKFKIWIPFKVRFFSPEGNGAKKQQTSSGTSLRNRARPFKQNQDGPYILTSSPEMGQTSYKAFFRFVCELLCKTLRKLQMHAIMKSDNPNPRIPK